VVLPGSLGGSTVSWVDGDEAVDWVTTAPLRGTDLFARRVAHRTTVETILSPDDDERLYRFSGNLFFATTEHLTDQFDYEDDPQASA
jgi:SulP family sulfate permease